MLLRAALASLLLASSGFSQQRGASSALTAHLLSRHNKAAPPDGVISLNYEIELVNILNLDEVAQTITVLVYVEEKWMDSSLSWNPDEFSNLTVTWLPDDEIWLPDIIIFNMLKHENLLHSVRAPALIRSSGQVVYTYPSVYTVMCAIDVSMFPLDSQHCALEISSWDYEEEKLQLNPSTVHALDHYQANEEWELVEVAVNLTHFKHEDITVSEIYFDIHIRRRPFFYMISLVTPSCIITLLSITGLFAPFSSTGERQEKFTLGVTAILTMAVLSLMVSEKVPHTSKDVPLLMGYFMTEMILIAVASILTSFIMRIHRKGVRGDPPPPNWLLRVLLITSLPKSLYTAITDSTRVGLGNGDAAHSEDWRGSSVKLLGLINESLDQISAQLSGLRGAQDDSKAAKRRAGVVAAHLIGTQPGWVAVASRLDLIALCAFVAVIAVLTARITILEAVSHETVHAAVSNVGHH